MIDQLIIIVCYLIEQILSVITFIFHNFILLNIFQFYRNQGLGFTGYQNTKDSFFELFTRLREERIIP
jgi:ABC-type phosphate/phosphonate transport system ATPase subunit